MNEALSREEELFDAARRIADASQRQSFLNSACDGDDALRVRIEKLLAASPQADHLFQTCISAVRLAPDESEVAATNAPLAEGEIPGNWIGPYRIAAKMGEGGCGEVYLAEQQQPVRRRVALKIIKLGMDTRAVIARFNAERQALAMMDHPGIAKVFDAGATSAGRPYFVMELVSGLKITEFCDKAKLDLRGRLDLFTQVCHAIQHAHQKGVVHRDIKPSNIIVTAEGKAKLVDMGLLTVEFGQHEYRFNDIVDLDSKKPLFTVEHEVRSQTHPMFARPLINRNPAQDNRNYKPGHDSLGWALP